MAEIQHISINTPDEEILRIIDEDAAVIIDEVIPTSKIDSILKELELDEETANNMIMEARSFWSEDENKD